MVFVSLIVTSLTSIIHYYSFVSVVVPELVQVRLQLLAVAVHAEEEGLQVRLVQRPRERREVVGPESPRRRAALENDVLGRQQRVHEDVPRPHAEQLTEDLEQKVFFSMLLSKCHRICL